VNIYCNFANELLCLFELLYRSIFGLACNSDGDLTEFTIIKSSFPVFLCS